MRDKALVMLSGGLDSATCLYWAKKRFSSVSAITFNYFRRIENEKKATRLLAQRVGVHKFLEIDLPFVREASDFSNGNFKPKEAGGRGILSSYVPARNMIFYSIAAYHAEFLGFSSIIGGHNRHDVQFFKDASASYIKKINGLFKEACLLCNGRAYKILLPLAGMQRKEIVKLAIKLRIPIELTWSCHRKGTVHCGKCYSCKQRLEAFSSIGLTDPAFKS